MISYRKWQYSLGAIAAVAQRCYFCFRYLFFMLQIYAFRNGIDQHFIAAILTVIGYSMNDNTNCI
jgi:SecD/SecF fusion protein